RESACNRSSSMSSMSPMRTEKVSIFKLPDGFNSMPLQDFRTRAPRTDGHPLLPTLNEQTDTICSNAAQQRKIQLKHFSFRHAIAKERTHPLWKSGSIWSAAPIRRTRNVLRAGMDVFDILDRLVAFPSVAGRPNGDIAS